MLPTVVVKVSQFSEPDVVQIKGSFDRKIIIIIFPALVVFLVHYLILSLLKCD